VRQEGLQVKRPKTPAMDSKRGRKPTKAAERKAFAKGGGVWVLPPEAERRACPFCLTRTVVPLPPSILEIQTDGTTHVCHPSIGGCNHGFAVGK
jgi:hypothetical protein